MTKEEFQKITRVEVSSTEWDAIEEMFMHADVDWTTFVHAWKRMVPVRWAQGRNGRRRLEVEQQRRLLAESVWEDARPALMLNRDAQAASVLAPADAARLLRAGFPVDGKAGTLLDRVNEFMEGTSGAATRWRAARCSSAGTSWRCGKRNTDFKHSET